MNSLQPKYDAYLKNQLPLLDSIPNFFMEEFSPSSAYTRSTGVELLQILVSSGLDLNYELPATGLPILLTSLALGLKTLFHSLVSVSPLCSYGTAHDRTN